MIPIHHLEKSIPDLTGLAVLIIAGSSFALSYVNLTASAIEAGINPWLSGLWPVCIDMLLIAGSLMILRPSLRKESPWVGWSVLLAFTGISTLFNVLHSPDGLTAQAAHAVPPIALCVSIELLMLTIKSDLTAQPYQESGHVCNFKRGVDQAANEHTCSDEDSIQQNEHTSEQQMQIPDHSCEQVDRETLIRDHFNEHPESSIAAAARHLGMSRSTVSRHFRALSSAGVISR